MTLVAKELARQNIYEELPSVENLSNRIDLLSEDMCLFYRDIEDLILCVIDHLNELFNTVIFNRIKNHEKKYNKIIHRLIILIRRFFCIYPEGIFLFQLNWRSINYTKITFRINRFYLDFESKILISLREIKTPVNLSIIAKKYVDFLKGNAIENNIDRNESFVIQSEHFLLNAIKDQSIAKLAYLIQ